MQEAFLAAGLVDSDTSWRCLHVTITSGSRSCFTCSWRCVREEGVLYRLSKKNSFRYASSEVSLARAVGEHTALARRIVAPALCLQLPQSAAHRGRGYSTLHTSLSVTLGQGWFPSLVDSRTHAGDAADCSREAQNALTTVMPASKARTLVFGSGEWRKVRAHVRTW